MIQQTRPPEPIALRGRAAEARKELQRVDPRLDLWWDHKQECFKVMERGRKTGTWSLTFYWRGVEGEYRDPLPVSPILSKLAQIDWSRYLFSFGEGDGMQAKVEEDLDGKRRAMLERRRQEKEYIRKSYVKECIKRTRDWHAGKGGVELKTWKEARAEHKEALEGALGAEQ